MNHEKDRETLYDWIGPKSAVALRDGMAAGASIEDRAVALATVRCANDQSTLHVQGFHVRGFESGADIERMEAVGRAARRALTEIMQAERPDWPR